MGLEQCEICLNKKTTLRCNICEQYSCKHCTHFVDDNLFKFQDLLPKHISNKSFCPNCFDEKVRDELSDYISIMDKAKDVNVYAKVQSSETRLMRRVAKQIKIKDCEDKEEALMRLAYLAAQKGFDTIVDVDIISKKVKLGGRYKKLVWDGTATPIDSTKK